MASYRIDHDEVTGVKGIRHLKGQIVDESVFHEKTLQGLVKAGAITLIKPNVVLPNVTIPNPE